MIKLASKKCFKKNEKFVSWWWHYWYLRIRCNGTSNDKRYLQRPSSSYLDGARRRCHYDAQHPSVFNRRIVKHAVHSSFSADVNFQKKKLKTKIQIIKKASNSNIKWILLKLIKIVRGKSVEVELFLCEPPPNQVFFYFLNNLYLVIAASSSRQLWSRLSRLCQPTSDFQEQPLAQQAATWPAIILLNEKETKTTVTNSNCEHTRNNRFLFLLARDRWNSRALIVTVCQ